MDSAPHCFRCEFQAFPCVAMEPDPIRKAIEMFLDFCKSGHINEGEILKVREAKGNYVFPLRIVAQVLLRMNRRFYDGDKSHVKNIFQCTVTDPIPDHFVRLGILRVLETKAKELGPSGVKGFHRTEDVVARLSPAGSVHLEMLKSLDYVAACAEDLWMTDEAVVERIVQRIGNSKYAHLSDATVHDNAKELVGYLKRVEGSALTNPSSYAAEEIVGSAHDWLDAQLAVDRAIQERQALVKNARLYVGNLPYDVSKEEVITAFASHGFDVSDVYLPSGNGDARGYAFVTLATSAEAGSALERLQQERIRGRPMRLNPATARSEFPNSPSREPPRRRRS